MSRRAQGLPITTVILAILGIVILVILFAIMTGRLAIFAGAVNECPGICLQPNIDDIKGQTYQPGVLENRAGCADVYEKELRGGYIASVRGGPDRDDPIICETCCQRLA